MTAPFETFDMLCFAQMFGAGFLAILFLQSGLDKVFQWSGNLSWLKGHFEKTPFKSMVPLLLFVVMVLEISAGLASGLGVISILTNGGLAWAQLGGILSAAALVFLFAGQRLAQDYEGAATLASYFTLVLVYMGLLYLV